MSGVLRAFIAIPLPEALQECLRNIQATLSCEPMDVRWVRPENIHLTLKFLGDIDRVQVSEIASRLVASVKSKGAFSLQTKSGGVFSDRLRVRALWVGLDDETGGLNTLHAAVGTAMSAMGFIRETRFFRPHLTLGRPRRSIDPPVLERCLAVLRAVPPKPFTVDRICLYQSQLNPSGPRYVILHTAMLPAAGVS